MGIAEIKQLQIMEALWDDLRSNADAILVPDWQKDILEARRNAVNQGKEKILDWDEIKDSLGEASE